MHETKKMIYTKEIEKVSSIANNPVKFIVYNEDKFHQPLSSEEDIAEFRYEMGSFDNYEEAVSFCKEYLDKTFDEIVNDSDDSESYFRKYWYHHGEDLFIVPSPEKHFSSSDYIEEKICEKYKNKK